MLVRTVQNFDNENFSIKQEWVDYEDVSPSLTLAILTAEDQRFFAHKGFDLEEMRRMRDEHIYNGEKVRGCSTISQQVAKNCFTFCSRTYARKIIEAYYTVLIEWIWGKERIFEVYLNVVETGYGLFGVESLCQEYFRSSSEKVSIFDAASIACVLPNPLSTTPYRAALTGDEKHSRITKLVSRQIIFGQRNILTTR